MESNQSIKVPHIKRDAKITITIGTQMIQSLDNLNKWLMIGHEDKAQEMQKKIENKEPLEPWESAVLILTQFLKGCGEQAEKDGNLYYKDSNELINGSNL